MERDRERVKRERWRAERDGRREARRETVRD